MPTDLYKVNTEHFHEGKIGIIAHSISNKLMNETKVEIKIREKTLAEFIISQLSNSPIKRKELLSRCRMNGFKISDRAMRKAVEELALSAARDLPIGTSQRGYYFINTDDAEQEALNELKSKARQLFKRASVVHEKWMKQKNGSVSQLSFEQFLQD